MRPILIAFVCVGGALLVALLALVPLRFGWPRRVRWLVATQSLGHVAGPYWVSMDLREVRLRSVSDVDGMLQLHVLEAGHPAAHTMILESPVVPPLEVLVMLREWAALATPMLLYIDPAGAATLDGPVAVVTELSRREALATHPPRGPR